MKQKEQLELIEKAQGLIDEGMKLFKEANSILNLLKMDTKRASEVNKHSRMDGVFEAMVKQAGNGTLRKK